MPIGAAIAGGIASGVGGSLVGSLLSPSRGGSAPGVAPTVQLPGQAEMAKNLQSGTQDYLKTAQQFYGMDPSYANQAFQAMYSNPYAAAAQTAAGQAGGMSGDWASRAAAAGRGAMDAGTQALQAGQQVWQTAADPQDALYRQMQQRVMDQSNAINSQYGLGASPVGAGVAGQNLTNFDLAWQQQQLQRQIQGQQALNQGINAYTGAAGTGLGFGQTGVGMQQQAGALPYQTAQGIGQGQFGALAANQAAMQGTMTPYQQQINNMANYLGLGQSAQAQAAGQSYGQQQLQRQDAANIGNLAARGIQAGMDASGWFSGGTGGSQPGADMTGFYTPTTQLMGPADMGMYTPSYMP